MADLTRPIKPRSHDRSHAGISHERLARRSYASCPRFWRLLCDPWSFQDTRRLANPEVSDGGVTLGWPWDAADRVFGPYGVGDWWQSRAEGLISGRLLPEGYVPDFGAAVLARGAFDFQGDDILAGLFIGVLRVTVLGVLAVAEIPSIGGYGAVGRVLEGD